MKKHVKNLKVCWAPLLAIAIAATVASCHNEKISEKAKQEIAQSTFASFEDSFQKSRFLLENFDFDNMTDSVESEIESTEEAGFSK